MSMLDRLKSENIFRVKLSEDKKKANIKEKCDGYFSLNLSKKGMLKLIQELQAIHDEMLEQPVRPEGE